MSRSLGANLTTESGKAVATPVHLIEIDHPTAGTLRWADGTAADGFSLIFGGNTYSLKQFGFSGIQWAGNLVAGFDLTFDAHDLTIIPTLLAVKQDTAITAYFTYQAAAATVTSSDVHKFFDGKITGGYSYSRGRFTARVARSVDYFPTWFVNSNNGYTVIIPPGTYVTPVGTFVLERER